MYDVNDMAARMVEGIEKSYGLMPSTGTLPCKLMCVQQTEISEMKMASLLKTPLLLLVLVRTEFLKEELIDYAQQSKEYQLLKTNEKKDFLNRFVLKFNHLSTLRQWMEGVTNIAVGLTMYYIRKDQIYLDPLASEKIIVPADLYGPEFRVHQLYQIYKLD